MSVCLRHGTESARLIGLFNFHSTPRPPTLPPPNDSRESLPTLDVFFLFPATACCILENEELINSFPPHPNTANKARFRY